MSELQM